MKKILLAGLLFPFLAFAQAGELQVGEFTVSYDSSEKTDFGVLYYYEDSLVASEHGVMMLVYRDDVVTLEAHDTSGDGEYDTFLSLNVAGDVTSMSGAGADMFERPAPVELSELMAAEERGAGEAGAPNGAEDLVGSLDSITIPSYHNYVFYIFTVLLIGFAYWWHLRKGKNKDD